MKRASLIAAIALVGVTAGGAGLVAAHSLFSANSQSPVTSATSSASQSVDSPKEAIAQSDTPSIEQPTTPLVAQTTSQPQPAANLNTFPHRRVVFRDAIASKPESVAFREQVRQAVRKRDVAFISKLIPPNGLPVGFGRPIPLKSLNLSNSDAFLWRILDKNIFLPCTTSVENPADFVCSSVARDFLSQYPAPPGSKGVEYEIQQVIVVGTNVNVRSQPTTNSAIVATLTNEAVKFDTKTYERESAKDFERFTHPLTGWTPVILPNGKKGFVSARYTHFPLEAALIFGKVNGQWQIKSVPSGD